MVARPRTITLYGSVSVVQAGLTASTNAELAEDERLRQELQKDLEKRLEGIKREYEARLNG